MLSACLPFVLCLFFVCFAMIAGWFRLLCGCLAVALRFLSNRVPAALRLFSGCWRLPSDCFSRALRAAFCLSSVCFPLAVRLLSDCFPLAFGLPPVRFPVSFRLRSGCFPIVAGLVSDCGCLLVDLRLLCGCSPGASQLPCGSLPIGSRLLSACFSAATGLFLVAVRLFCGAMPQLAQAANAAYARDAWQPNNRCTRHAAYTCFSKRCDGWPSSRWFCWGVCCLPVREPIGSAIIWHV